MAKTKRIVLNKGVLDRLPVPEAGRVYVYDAKVRGLTVCVTSAGTKTFYLYCRMNGKPTRYRIGGWPQVAVHQAREVAQKRLAEIVDGRNPHRERIAARNALTLSKLFERWVAEHAKVRIRSWRVDHDRFVKDIRPVFGERPLASIEVEELSAWHHQIGDQRGRVIANRLLELVSRVYAWGARQRIYRGENPCTFVAKFPEAPRERFLQPDEAPRLFAALEAEDSLWGDFFRLALFTGARKSNLCAMRWDQILDDVWTIPRGLAKSGKPITVHLVPEAVEILERRRQSRSEWVFPGAKPGTCITYCDDAWNRVLKRAGLENLTVHDLRRSFASYQALAGSSLVAIGRSLGHQPGSKSTAIYARLTHDAVRESAERGVAKLLAAAKGGASNG